tara:strand:- start:683 stop:1405 length:723 start_codon:yes stop_codon:yes gene_type:complete
MNNLYLRLVEILINFIDEKNKNYIFDFLKNKSPKSELIIFDIGTHKGETLKIFLKNFNIKKIYCFEPNQKIFNILENNKKFKDKKISLFNFGFGDKQEYKKLNIFLDTSSSTFNTINQKSGYFMRKNKILSPFSNKFFSESVVSKIETVSNFIVKNNIHKIDILKIDTEGYEYNILKGIKRTDFDKINYIYFEHHYDLMIEKKYKFSDIDRLLSENNFKKVFKIKMKYRKTFEYIYEKKN